MKIKHISINGKSYKVEGKSAYEVACDKGFKGTEEEWLEFLKGQDGKDGKDADVTAITALQAETNTLANRMTANETADAKLTRRVQLLEYATEGNVFDYEESEEICSKKQIPLNSLSHALIEKVGGYSFLAPIEANLLPTKFTVCQNDGDTWEDELLQWGYTKYYLVDNGDGSVRINAYGANLHLEYEPFDLPAGTYTFDILGDFKINENSNGIFNVSIRALNANGDEILLAQANPWDNNHTLPLTFTLEEDAETVEVIISDIGAIGYLDRTITPCLSHGDTIAHTIDLGGLNAITVHGKNLIPDAFYDYSNWEKGNSWSLFDISHIFPADGTYTVKVLKNPNMTWGDAVLRIQKSTDGGTTWNAPDGITSGYLLASGNLAGQEGRQLTFAKGDKYRLCIYPQEQATLDKLLNLQIECGSTATEYAPYYIKQYLLPLPLTDWGLGLSQKCCNYIDFENKTYVRMVEQRQYAIGDENASLFGLPEPVTDGVMTIAPLASPIVEDISDLLPDDNFIDVEDGGYITFDGYLAVNKFTFQVEV